LGKKEFMKLRGKPDYLSLLVDTCCITLASSTAYKCI